MPTLLCYTHLSASANAACHPLGGETKHFSPAVSAEYHVLVALHQRLVQIWDGNVSQVCPRCVGASYSTATAWWAAWTAAAGCPGCLTWRWRWAGSPVSADPRSGSSPASPSAFPETPRLSWIRNRAEQWSPAGKDGTNREKRSTGTDPEPGLSHFIPDDSNLVIRLTLHQNLHQNHCKNWF